MDPSPSPAKPWEIGRNAQAAGAGPRAAPPKPWANRTAGAQPPRPIGAATNTLPSATAAAAGSVPPGAAGAASSITRPGARPWERPGAGTAYGQRTPMASTAYSSTAANRPYGYGTSGYGGYGTGGYGASGYGASGYRSGYGGYGGYGGGMYGSSYGGGMYGNSYGGGMYGRGMYGGYGGYGGGMYGSSYGGGMYGNSYGGGGMPGNEMEQIYGQQGEPGAWSFLESVQNIVHAFGHLSWLLQGNFEALHMFFGSFFGLTERVGHFTSELLGMLRTIAFFKYLYDLVRSFFGRPRSTLAPLPTPLPHPRPVLPPNTQ